MSLYRHQEYIVQKAPLRHVLVWGTGTGKTLASIMLANEYMYPTLVICPKALKENWQRNVRLWGHTSFTVLTKEEFKKHVKELPCYNAVIVDEAHYFFGMKSQLKKSLKWYFDYWNTPCRWFLTATPYRSTPWDVYVLSELLGFPMHYPVFREKFFYDIRMGNKIVPKIRPNKENELAEIVKSMGSIVALEDCVDVPNQIHETEYIDMTYQQKKAIKEITDIQPLPRYTKEHQITGGVYQKDEYSDITEVKSLKRERAYELAADHKKIIFVCRYNNEIDALAKDFKKFEKPVHIIRGNTKDKQTVIDELQESDAYILLVNAACSEGWELPDCSVMVFYSYDFSLKNYIQMQGRIQRINNIKKNVYISLICADTVDEGVYRNIMNKQDFHVEIYAQEQET